MFISYLVAVHHEVVGGDEGFEDHHPARVGSTLEKCVCQLGNVHIHLIGAVDQIWDAHERKVKTTITQKAGQKAGKM